MTRVLGSIDYFRSDPQGDSVAESMKEWQHFVVHGDHARIIVNFSISRSEQPTCRDVGRVIVLVHHRGWSGTVADVPVDDIRVERGRTVQARFGASRIGFEHGAYVVELYLPEHRIGGRLRFVPDSTPFAKNNQPLAGGRMSWLFVPRLLADGYLSVDGTRFSMHSAAAYHDHNWGHFRWGDDFGWQWGSMLPTARDDPWSIVFMRMTDRAHTSVRSQCLYVWHDGRPLAMFRDETLAAETRGLLRRSPRLTVPGPMALVAPGSASDVPASLVLRARRGDDTIELDIRPQEYARIAIPSERAHSRPVLLHEVSASVEATGVLRGKQLSSGGSGVIEFLR